MKQLALSLVVLLLTAQSEAGRMKEIFIMTNESVALELGFDEEELSIFGHRFVTAANADLAIQTQVTLSEANKTWTCLTTYKKTETFFEELGTVCN